MKQLNINVGKLGIEDLNGLLSKMEQLRQEAVEEKKKRQDLFLSSVEAILNEKVEPVEGVLTVQCDGKAFKVSQQRQKNGSRKDRINAAFPVGSYRIRKYKNAEYKIKRESDESFEVAGTNYASLTAAANAIYQGKNKVSGLRFWITDPTAKGPFTE